MKRPQRLEPLLELSFEKNNWEGKDRAFFNELANGIIRRHGRLQWILDTLSDRKLPGNPFVIASAAVGLYQLLYHDRIPFHAAVDTAVSLARRYAGPEVGGWCNAVLRRAIGSLEKLSEPDFSIKNESKRLSTFHSYPVWMVDRWKKVLRKKQLEDFLGWNNRRADVCIRLTRSRTSTSKAYRELGNKGVAVSPVSWDDSFARLKRAGDPGKISLIMRGEAVIQDVSQGQVVKLVDAASGETILDLCAAPGGKTIGLADLYPECRITATDKSQERLKKVAEAVRRSELTNVEIKPYSDILNSRKKYNYILVDAPCTGTGALAKRPDLRWRLSVADINKMQGIQSQLLRYAAERIHDNGSLIYSTCSVEKEENETVVEKFLFDHSKFNISDIRGLLPVELRGTSGYLKILGPELHCDGVFAARLTKEK